MYPCINKTLDPNDPCHQNHNSILLMNYWCAPGTRLHLHAPGVTEGKGHVFVMALHRVTLLNARELKE